MVAMQGQPEPTPSSAWNEQAAAVLRHAQHVAEELQSQAEAEARSLTEQAQRLRAEAEELHAEAAHTRDLAHQTLADSSADAQQVVSDAGDQARLLMEAAATHHDQIVAEAES